MMGGKKFKPPKPASPKKVTRPDTAKFQQVEVQKTYGKSLEDDLQDKIDGFRGTADGDPVFLDKVEQFIAKYKDLETKNKEKDKKIAKYETDHEKLEKIIREYKQLLADKETEIEKYKGMANVSSPNAMQANTQQTQLDSIYQEEPVQCSSSSIYKSSQSVKAHSTSVPSKTVVSTKGSTRKTTTRKVNFSKWKTGIFFDFHGKRLEKAFGSAQNNLTQNVYAKLTPEQKAVLDTMDVAQFYPNLKMYHRMNDDLRDKYGVLTRFVCAICSFLNVKKKGDHGPEGFEPYGQKFNLERHVRLKHLRRVKCKACQKIFANRTLLGHHIQSMKGRKEPGHLKIYKIALLQNPNSSTHRTIRFKNKPAKKVKKSHPPPPKKLRRVIPVDDSSD